MGNIVNFFESIIGNLFYNIGLRKLVLAFNQFDGNVIAIEPVLRSEYYYRYKNEIPPLTREKVYHRNDFVPVSNNTTQIINRSAKVSNSSVIKPSTNQKSIQFCGYCGYRIKHENARFCAECGNRMN